MTDQNTACRTTRHCADHDFCHRCMPSLDDAVRHLAKAIDAAGIEYPASGRLYSHLAAGVLDAARQANGQQPCDVGFVDGSTCAKPAGHRPPGSDDPHTPAPAVGVQDATQPTTDETKARAELYSYGTAAFETGVPEIIHQNLNRMLDAYRAAILNSAADEIASIDFHPNAKAQCLELARGFARRLRTRAAGAES
ncbi:hypothetical protein ACIQKB_03990 [Streptomyces sp. NPDC092046]|uniref:hypothetical protein n=1 Tax=Streptomyces sp. NPDC092046 TaxID=3366009 RepID=UPI0038223D81